jgi:hypothetical protein
MCERGESLHESIKGGCCSRVGIKKLCIKAIPTAIAYVAVCQLQTPKTFWQSLHWLFPFCIELLEDHGFIQSIDHSPNSAFSC